VVLHSTDEGQLRWVDPARGCGQAPARPVAVGGAVAAWAVVGGPGRAGRAGAG